MGAINYYLIDFSIINHISLIFLILSSRACSNSFMSSREEFICIKIILLQQPKSWTMIEATLCCSGNYQCLSESQSKTLLWAERPFRLSFPCLPKFCDIHAQFAFSPYLLYAPRKRSQPSRRDRQYEQHKRNFHKHPWIVHHFSTWEVRHSCFQKGPWSWC